MPEQDFSYFLTERLRERGISIRRLGELTGIAPAHLEDLIAGRFSRLPAAPYLRGYLERIGRVLDFDHDLWWEELVRSGSVQSSGPADELPKNRFAPRPTASSLWLLLAALVIVAYVGVRFSAISGKPRLTLLSPRENIITAHAPTFLIRGELEGGSELLINAERVELDPDGRWEKEILLRPGLNTIEIKARKFLGGETRLIRQIIYEPSSTSTGPTEEAASGVLE